MKKVMLFTVALLFSLGASAANITIAANGLTNAGPIGSTINNAPYVTQTWQIDGSSPPGVENNVSIKNQVTTDATTPVKVTWNFAPSAGLNGRIYDYAAGHDVNVFGGLGGTPEYSYVFNMLIGSSYDMNFVGAAGMASKIILTIQAVPIPAALWLFAPALMGLLGLLGLRPKSKGLVVA